MRTAETAEAVEEVVIGLRNTTGRKVKPLKRPVISRLQSVQVCGGGVRVTVDLGGGLVWDWMEVCVSTCWYVDFEAFTSPHTTLHPQK